MNNASGELICDIGNKEFFSPAAVTSTFAELAVTLHYLDFPQDMPPNDVREHLVENYQRYPDTQPIKKYIVNRLGNCAAFAQVVLGINSKISVDLSDKAISTTQQYLVLATEGHQLDLLEDSWLIKHPELRRLGNPFIDLELTGYLLKNHAKNGQVAGIGKIATMSRLAPGYFSL